ncbi:MlaD family protein [Lacihabitans soyangensis]|uniref:MCE family protein n=1 Tax=Lacihabitans soyangensis TaxID=869394 RepID=A0AAE3H2I2_9BACT|nr:MlaD family protein [Lacihabitans soyangensis]MCP9763879.1 MCE family protein [Lacihabitans soyangensis]
MNFKREAKVGLLGLIGIVIFYFGFSYLKGSDLFSTTQSYRVYYKDVMGLEVSNPVTYSGVVVGRVLGMKPDYEKDRVEVTLAIKKEVKLTSNTLVLLSDDGLIGGKLLKLKIQAGEKAQSGQELKGEIESGLMQMMQTKLDPTLKNVDSLTVTLTKVVGEFAQTGQALKVLLASATTSTAGVNGIIANNSKNLSAITGNAAVLTQNLNTLTKSLDAQLKPILEKTGSFTDSLSQVKLGSTVNSLNATIKDLQGVVNGINEGKGTLGKLAGNDSLYVNLDKTAASLNMLLSDMKSNPRRYVHFSLFGGKDKTKK